MPSSSKSVGLPLDLVASGGSGPHHLGKLKTSEVLEAELELGLCI